MKFRRSLLAAWPLLLTPKVAAFGISWAKSSRTAPLLSRAMVVDPISIGTVASGVSVESLAVTLGISAEEVVNIGVAVASAMAGAATQLPRINELETQLEASRVELNNTVASTKEKISELEDKLFLFDQQFEEQTDRFKKNYDEQMQSDLKARVAKLKQDYLFKLDIAVSKEKSRLLTDQLEVVNTITGKRQEELASLRLQKQTLDLTNRELEQALLDSETELARLRKESSKKKLFGLFP